LQRLRAARLITQLKVGNTFAYLRSESGDIDSWSRALRLAVQNEQDRDSRHDHQAPDRINWGGPATTTDHSVTPARRMLEGHLDS
jgi:hypothetical protein